LVDPEYKGIDGAALSPSLPRFKGLSEFEELQPEIREESQGKFLQVTKEARHVSLGIRVPKRSSKFGDERKGDDQTMSFRPKEIEEVLS
jgi:hypothetical protein